MGWADEFLGDERFRAGQDDGVEKRRHAGGNVPAAIVKDFASSLRVCNARRGASPAVVVLGFGDAVQQQRDRVNSHDKDGKVQIDFTLQPLIEHLTIPDVATLNPELYQRNFVLDFVEQEIIAL